MWKKYIKLTLKTALSVLFFYILGRANCGYSVSPFGISAILAVLYLNYKTKYLTICFLVGNTLAGYSLKTLYITLNVFAVVVLTAIVLKQIKKRLNKYTLLVPFIFSNVCFCYLNFGGLKQNLVVTFAVLLEVVAMYVFLNFFVAIKREYNTNLNLDEKICGSLLLVILGMGLANTNIYFFEFSKFMGVFIILITAYTSPRSTFLIAGLLGLGSAIHSLNILYVAVFVVYGLSALAFKTSFKVFSVLAVTLSEILLGLFFKTYTTFSWFSLISVGGGGLVFLTCPKFVLEYVKDVVGVRRDNVAIRSLVNRTKTGICKRMNELAQVFEEMNVVYRGMIKGTLPEDEAKTLLADELANKVCANCPEKNMCNRNRNTRDVFEMLVECGFERGKVNLLDVPQYLVSKCGKINYLVSVLNQSIKSYKNYTHLVSNMDASRTLIADQLLGVNEMLKKLSNEVRLNITFDTEKENKLIEELSYVNIVCYEAIVYEEREKSKNVSLVVRNCNYKKEEVEKIVSNVCKTKMALVSDESAVNKGCSILYFKTKSNFDLVFGCSSISKGGVLKNGDAHSVVKLDNGKYMVALCDGVGSGEKAQRISNLSITLIENFYKAGFENDTILNSINKLLSLNNEENFSSVDLCVLDFNNNTGDFIKLGATYGFVKNKDQVEVIESSGLPIGVLEEMKPHITKRTIKAFDTIVLLSDGISDAFDEKSDLQEFIENITTTNPQTISEEILDRAVDLNDGKIKDDMTVLVVRVFPI